MYRIIYDVPTYGGRVYWPGRDLYSTEARALEAAMKSGGCGVKSEEGIALEPAGDAWAPSVWVGVNPRKKPAGLTREQIVAKRNTYGIGV